MTTVTAPPRPNPWPVRIAVGCGGLLLVTFLVIVGLVVLAFLPQRTEMGVCRSKGLGAECTQVPAERIARIMSMDLPAGTVVRSSTYRDWMDDSLDAVVVVPRDRVAVWEASLAPGGWPGARECASPQGARCADRGPVSGDAVMRSYVRIDGPDGTELRLHWNQF